MLLMVQTTCHQTDADGADGLGFAKARFAKGVGNEGSGRRHLPNSLASIEDAVASGEQVLNGPLRIRNDERFEPATYC
jgi:hypothetical protein